MSHRRVADYWSKLAQQQGYTDTGRQTQEDYPARSVFKLKEIDFKFKLFREGNRVLDLGCSPGSWSMFAAERVGPSGFVLGLDLQPLPVTVPLPPHVTILRQDVYNWNIHVRRGHRHFSPRTSSFDVLLSDMAPSTSGIKVLDANASHDLCQQALHIAQTVLKPNGTLVMKIFQGSGFQPLLKQVQSTFHQTHTLKPTSTRGESVETFIIARRRKSSNKQKAKTEETNTPTPVPTRSS